MNMLRNAAKWLDEQRHAHMSDPYVYTRRGASEGIAVQATIGKTDTDEIVEQSMIAVGDMADFILQTQYFVAGEFVAPESGDRLTDSTSGAVYELAATTGDRCWRYSDEYDNAVRLHTQRVG